MSVEALWSKGQKDVSLRFGSAVSEISFQNADLRPEFYSIVAANCRSTCFHSPLMMPARICVAVLPFWFC